MQAQSVPQDAADTAAKLQGMLGQLTLHKNVRTARLVHTAGRIPLQSNR
jgi:hypothetical protein